MVNKMTTKYDVTYTEHNQMERLEHLEFYETYSKDNLIEYILKSCDIVGERNIKILTQECLTHLKYLGKYFLEVKKGFDIKTLVIKVVE